jgi:hypothetical protein
MAETATAPGASAADLPTEMQAVIVHRPEN